MRRYGRTKQMFEEMEKAYAKNPDMIIWGPTCSVKSADDVNDLHRFYVDYDNPWDIPIGLLLKDPELYHKLVADKKAMIDKLWGGIARPIIDGVKGKAIIISKADQHEAYDLIVMWGQSDFIAPLPNDGLSVLKRFFIPAANGLTDEYGNPKDQQP